MIDSVALTAPISPPLTGASSIAAPFDATSAASRRATTGEMLLMSITTAPDFRPSAMPSGPAIDDLDVRRVGQHRDDHLGLAGHVRW